MQTTPWGPSLALDSLGNPHIAWHDGLGGGGEWEIYYAYWDGSSWVTHGGANTGGGVSNNAGLSVWPSLALDSSGNPHIAWIDASGSGDLNEIYYAYWDGDSWETYGGGNTGGGVSNNAGNSVEPSLALDSLGNPHVAWYDNSGGGGNAEIYEIYYAYWNGTSWVTHGGANTGGGVSNNAGGSGSPSLALDSSGRPHIAWTDNIILIASSGNWEIYYRYWNSGVTPPEENLLEKYAPILYMHPKEKYHPTNALYMLAKSRLYEKVEVIKKRRTIWKGKPVISDPPNRNTLKTYNGKEYYLKLQKRPKLWKQDQTVYGREIKLSSNVRVLQYWFFYMYNDWGGLKKGGNKHEGDWEMVQLILLNNHPDTITYSMHEGGLPLKWDDVLKHEEYPEHPLVFVTRGGHGSWNTPGSHLWYQPFCLQCIDETSSKGDILVPENMSIPSVYSYKLEDLNDPDNNWVHWQGFWGNQTFRKKNGISDLGSSGPAGPPCIDYIEDDGKEGRWEDPLSWGYGPNPPGYIICASENSKLVVHDMEGNIERRFINCIPTPLTCGWCTLTEAVYTEKDLVFDVYSRDGKEVNLRIIRYKRSGEEYEVEFKGLDITRKGKASLTFSPKENPGFEIILDKDPEGYYESYRLPDYLEIKEVD